MWQGVRNEVGSTEERDDSTSVGPKRAHELVLEKMWGFVKSLIHKKTLRRPVVAHCRGTDQRVGTWRPSQLPRQLPLAKVV